MYPVYLDNSLGNNPGGTNNLKVLTQQYNDGKRSASTIFAILTGLGISAESAKFAIDNYLTEEPLNQNNYNEPITTDDYSDCGMDNKSMGSLTINIVVQGLNKLKDKIDAITTDESVINYSANTVKGITESILSDIRDLKENLKALNSGKLDEKEEVITKQRIHVAATKSNPAYYYANLSINNLNNFSNIVAVKDYINEMLDYIKSNFYTNYISNLIYEMESRTDKEYYSDVVKDLSHLAKESEKYITESMNVVLNKHAWVPKVKMILEHNANRTKKLVSNKDVKIELLHSPVQINEDGSYVFLMDNCFYKVKGDDLVKVTESSQLTDTFMRMCSVLNEFDISNNTLKVYKPHSTLEVIVENNSVSINGIKVDKRDVGQIRNAILTSNFYSMNEVAKVENILLVLENFGLVKEIDIVTRLRGLNGNTVNIIKLNEDRVYINRVYKNNYINELFSTDSYKHAQTIVNEYVDFDITNSVYSILDRDAKIKNNINSEISEVKEQLTFLNSTLNSFVQKTNGITSDEIKEAIELLESEIRIKEIKLQTLYEQFVQV